MAQYWLRRTLPGMGAGFLDCVKGEVDGTHIPHAPLSDKIGQSPMPSQARCWMRGRQAVRQMRSLTFLLTRAHDTHHAHSYTRMRIILERETKTLSLSACAIRNVRISMTIVAFLSIRFVRIILTDNQQPHGITTSRLSHSLRSKFRVHYRRIDNPGCCLKIPLGDQPAASFKRRE